MTTATRRLAATAAVAAVALSSAACSTKLSNAAPPATTVAPTTTVQGAATPAQTKAAGYRAQLTYLMVEHVFLLGRVTKEIVAAGGIAAGSTTTPTTVAGTPTSVGSTATTVAGTATTVAGGAQTPTTATTATTTTVVGATAVTALTVPGGDDAASALDKNSHDIADLLAQAQGYGSDFDTAFYQQWTARINDVAAYTTAKATHDAAGATTAVSSLAANATVIAKLVHQVNKYIAVTTVSSPGTGLADELQPNNTAATTFVDAQVAKSTAAVTDVVAAAETIRHTATYLAAAAAKLDPEQFPGTATGTAANLRAAVTSALFEHVELAILVCDELVAGRAGAPESAALAVNTGALANIVIVNFGDQAARDFTTLWNGYVTALEGYARAKAGGAGAPDLSGVGQQVGAFFAQQAPQLNATLIAADMQQMVDGLKATVDASATQSPEVTSLRVAGATVPKLASDIAEGIAEFKPAQYLP